MDEVCVWRGRRCVCGDEEVRARRGVCVVSHLIKYVVVRSKHLLNENQEQ